MKISEESFYDGAHNLRYRVTFRCNERTRNSLCGEKENTWDKVVDNCSGIVFDQIKELMCEQISDGVDWRAHQLTT